MNFIIDNWQALASLIGGAIAFITGYKIRKIDVKEKEAEALQSIQKVYDTFTVQTNKKFDELYEEISNLKKENLEQRGDLRTLQKDNRDLHIEVSKLLKKNNELVTENILLKNTTSSNPKR